MDQGKQAVGTAAADLVQENAIVGLGSGSTAACFIEALGARMQKGLRLKAVVATSKQSEALAHRLNMPVKEIDSISKIDIAIDGADETDAQKRMIKGGGGAHVRERIVASASELFIVIIDESKLVPSIGVGKLPVEILPFGSFHTKKKLEELGYRGAWRVQHNHPKTFFMTDNGNFILDLTFPSPPSHPERDHERIKGVPGVVDTGFFFNMAHRILVGHKNGSVSSI